ncbi:MAG TPA: HAMP domain-containing sensor histidine kinase, partial [Dehalococcoidia bacterium]|nr:HAMP domain-containing sensor histidine kinase [Dehalococcoidia bacterium]
ELSRIESGEQPLVLRPVEAAQLLADAVERLRPQAERGGLRLTADIPPDLGQANIDGARIERAVLNLLNNAIKFTPPGGRVTLRARREDGQLVVEVRDTGIGIAETDLPRVFERFYKADQARAGGGSGLGLALVKHAVEAHGGSVEVESELDKGSVFRFCVPV